MENTKKKIVFKIWSDVIRTDNDFIFKSMPVIFDHDFHYHHLKIEGYRRDKYSDNKKAPLIPLLDPIPPFHGFVDLDPYDEEENPTGGNGYYELPEYRVEIPMEYFSDDSDALAVIHEFAAFICWNLIKCIDGRFYCIDNFINYFGELGNKFRENQYIEELRNEELRNSEPIVYHENYQYKFRGNADGDINISIDVYGEDERGGITDEK